MIKIQGLDKFAKKMDEFAKAMGELDGKFGDVEFNPHDPGSIEQAIHRMEAMIDERVRTFERNDMVKTTVTAMKEKYRQMILDRAAAARLESGAE